MILITGESNTRESNFNLTQIEYFFHIKLFLWKNKTDKQTNMLGSNNKIKRTTLVFDFQTNTNATDASSCTILFVRIPNKFNTIKYMLDATL